MELLKLRRFFYGSVYLSFGKWLWTLILDSVHIFITQGHSWKKDCLVGW